MRWDSNTGCWSLFGNHKSKVYLVGTTPRNADHVTFTLRLGNLYTFLDFGKHSSFNIFWSHSETEEETGLDLRKRFCRKNCFSTMGFTCAEVWAIEWTYKDERRGWAKRKPHAKLER